MDRSFLSSDQLIKASRDFVCIRTATYEDKQEAEFLKQAFVTRPGGTLRNFGYCILSPDGKEKLRRSERGPNFVYASSAAMAADLRKIAAQYPAKETGGDQVSPVPMIKNVRLGINVASCDGLPCVVILGQNLGEVNRSLKKLSRVVWNEDVAGKFIYASTTRLADLHQVSGVTAKAGFWVIKPGPYGIQGQVIQSIDSGISDQGLKDALLRAANAFDRTRKNHGLHVRQGRRTDQSWKTEVPVPERVRSRSRRPPGRSPQR
ncbi:MAG: hypothetical protein VX438_16490 [Planctomycetota bacterium]|nr:hypothetical protein [Planctomycetota bacterium]